MPSDILDCLQDCYDPLSNDDIDRFEQKLGVRLAVEYRKFLLRHNGGYFQHTVLFELPYPRNYMSGGILDAMYGIHGRHGCTSLESAADAYRGRIAAEMLPIGGVNEHELCLKVSSEGFGEIHLWDQDLEDVDDEQPFHFLAATITAFFRLLKIDLRFEKHEEMLPIFQAVERGDVSVVQQYLAGGGDVDARNAIGHTLLMCSSRNCWPKIAALLIARKANVNAVDDISRSALHYAAAAMSVDISKMLLAAGTRTDMRDRSGSTPLADAQKSLSYRIVEILRHSQKA